jgi:hypothetical protein
MPVGNETRIRFAREDHETASPIRVAQGAFQRVREEHLARENLRRDGTRVPSLQSDVCVSDRDRAQAAKLPLQWLSGAVGYRAALRIMSE